MKGIFLFITSLVLSSTVSAKTYTIRFDKADYHICIQNGVVDINKKSGLTISDSDTDSPALPYSLFRILRPLNSTSTNYRVSFKSVPCNENVRMKANSPIMTTNSALPTRKGTWAYAKKSLSEPVQFLGDMNLYGFAYASFKITPFVYDITKQELRFIPEVVINIPDETSDVSQWEMPDSKKQSQNGPDYLFKSSVEEFVLNPEELDMLYSKYNKSTFNGNRTSVGDPNVEYLIVTTNTLSPSFQKLRNWKTQKGVRADIVTTSYIYSLYSSDSHPLAIKKYLYNYYNNGHNLKWVLLAGDSEYVPSPMCKIEALLSNNSKSLNGISESDTTPCDYYYSCFGGTFNWDGNGNGILGETTDGVNLSPYLYVSRSPVRDTIQANNFVDKVVAYEKTGPSTVFLNQILLTGSTDPDEDIDRALYQGKSIAQDASEKMFNQYIYNNFNGISSFYFDTNCNSYPYNATNLKNKLNSTQHLVHMDCHGSYLFWPTYDDSGNEGFFTSHQVDSLTNLYPMIILTTACYTSGFDRTTCLGESFISNEHGAVAYIGSSRFGLENGRTADMSYAYNGLFFKKLFTHQPATAPHRLGSVMAETKKEFIDLCNSNVNGYRYLQYAINPFGDPEMPIYTNATLSSLYPVISNEGDDFTVTTVCPDYTVTMESIDGSLYEVAKHVSYSHTFQNVTKFVRFTITADGYRTYESDWMYPTGNLSISGPTLVCDSAVFSVNNLPANATVSWSHPFMILDTHSNTPSVNQCLLTNNHYTQFPLTTTGKIYATITLGGRQAGILQKNIRISGWQSITYTQFASDLYPSLSSTQASLTSPNYVNPGCEIYLYSKRFKLMNISHSGVTPSTWEFNNNNDYLTFSLPNSSVGQPFTIHVRANPGEGDCNNIDITFIATTNNLNSQNSSLAEMISVNGGISVRLGLQDDKTKWNLKIINAFNGESVVDRDIQGLSSFIDTSGWKSGLYVVRCQIGDKVVTEKMTIKQ